MSRLRIGSGTSTTTAFASAPAAPAIPVLPEAVVEVTNFEGDYEGKWSMLRMEVEGINRTDESAGGGDGEGSCCSERSDS